MGTDGADGPDATESAEGTELKGLTEAGDRSVWSAGTKDWATLQRVAVMVVSLGP